MFVAALIIASVRQAGPITLAVDASQVTRNILHVHERIPVTGGPVRLVYPKWIPGEHGPYGPINDIVHLHFRVNGSDLPWRRDDVEMYEFRILAPSNPNTIDVDFDDVWQPENYSTLHLARLKWNNFLFYPAGVRSDDVMMQPTLHLPNNWKCACALPNMLQQGNEVSFAAVNLTTLVDSPVLCGEYYNPIRLNNSAPIHTLEMFGDTPESVQLPPNMMEQCRQMVRQSGELYRSRHYRSYHFLLSFSDHGAGDGLEHHECSEDGLGLNAIKENPTRLGYLLCHEFTHSWNGKYRRPAGMATPNYQEPMKDDLLWIYEGLTEYLGTTLMPRSGVCTPEYYRESLASICAVEDHRTGRTWRTVDDVARSLPSLDSPNQWQNARRQRGDFYYEGVMIWLDADVTIRNLTHGARSLNDFCRIFHGGPEHYPIVRPYSLQDVIVALNQVVPYDWARFFRDRVFSITLEVTKGGIVNGGWRLVYNETPNPALASYERAAVTGATYSLGLRMAGDGVIDDVVFGMPGDKAGLSPGMQITSVNGGKYSGDALKAAIRARGPIHLGISYLGENFTRDLDYRGGEMFPHLVRDASRPDVLSDVSGPLSR